ncbi:unnamed protein product [Tilletia controversa]|uniref:Proteasome assembly chaperone 2 n=3 Tax=Tilletia TaxID=13289 RepID=A0A8X7MZI5_9BASI|nr:hypothetical protein CF336_g862 [Tilletia laevis]KAE8204693.1 hypothetical protein CF328_g939 [Tilletia controversa]KAE8264914.1 hypothetical protein A4X03_0g607 [Tilletia caries]KAE8208292.1 hypothetical protein CF335_g519 [Tilletia laevis]KAE8254582.1 hypothetical protein A4X06_0g827 [Tilletia controversa]
MSSLSFFPSQSPGADLSGHTLIVPAVSIGNVPQLTVDLLIHHVPLGLRYLGAFDSTEWCLPYACPQDHVSSAGKSNGADTSMLGLPLQLYSNSSLRLTVLQQRSPILKVAKRDFALALLNWAKSAGIAQILVLSSLDAGLRVDAEMHIPLVHLLASPASRSSSSVLKTLAQSFPAFQPQATHEDDLPPRPKASPSSGLPFLPGAGLTRLLLQAAAEDSLPVGALLMFAGEGDNRGDAHAMATFLLDILKRASESEQDAASAPSASAPFERDGAFKEPRSWLTVFGQRMDQAIYG